MEPGREVARRAIRRVHGWRRDYHFERTYLAFHSWFRFRSRSDRWCAIEPRGEGLGCGVRSQGGAQGARGASKTLSAANAGQRRHIIAHGLIALEREFSFRPCWLCVCAHGYSNKQRCVSPKSRFGLSDALPLSNGAPQIFRMASRSDFAFGSSTTNRSQKKSPLSFEYKSTAVTDTAPAACRRCISSSALRSVLKSPNCGRRSIGLRDASHTRASAWFCFCKRDSTNNWCAFKSNSGLAATGWTILSWYPGKHGS